MLAIRGKKFSFCVTGVFGALAMIYGGMAQAANLTPEQELELRKQVIEQTKRLDALRQQMAEEDAKLAQVRRALGIDALGNIRGTGTAAAQPEAKEPLIQLAQSSQPSAAPARSGSSQGGDSKAPAVAQIFEQPGVLTPRGKFVFEPGLQYGYSSSNRVSLVGYTIIPALHIGLIDIREVKRNTFTANFTGRWGITNRLEIEAKLPYVYRSDSVISRPYAAASTIPNSLTDSTGSGIGDIEVTGRYQLNEGGIDKPYYVGSLRFKSRTGKDPFEVRTETGNPGQMDLQRELPTGSGFYTLQPGLTVLYPTDPAVFFGGVSYQYNFKRSNISLNTTDPAVSGFLGDVKPGDVLGFNFGMGLSLNEKSSFSIGYDHASVGKTKVSGGSSVPSVRTQLGTLLIGYSHRLNPTTSLNVSLGAGITRDTPDLTLSVRLPMSF